MGHHSSKRIVLSGIREWFSCLLREIDAARPAERAIPAENPPGIVNAIFSSG